MPHIYVSLERDEDGYPPYDTEELDASEVGTGQYRIEGIPVFAYGLSRGDLVRVVRVEGDPKLWITEVVKPSDHWTARVLPRGGLAPDDVVAEFSGLGCAAYATPFGLVAIDIPARVHAKTVLEKLNQGRAAERWDFDLGVNPA